MYDKLYHSLYNFFLSHFFKRNVTKIYSQATFFMYYLPKLIVNTQKKRARNLLKYYPLTTCHTKCHINTTTNFKLPWHDMYISALKVANSLSKNPVSSPCQENVLNSLNTHQNPLQINFSFAKMSQHRHPPLLQKKCSFPGKKSTHPNGKTENGCYAQELNHWPDMTWHLLTSFFMTI